MFDSLKSMTELIAYILGFFCIMAILAFGFKLLNRIGKDNPQKPLPGKLPYLPKDSLLSNPELNAYRMIASIVGGKLLVCCKVGLKDFLFINGTKDRTAFFRRISQKHVDFLLCHPVTSKPICGIEWDDSSHNSAKARERDEFVEQVYRDAGFPLLRFKTNVTTDELSKALAPYLDAPALTEKPEAPICPKCLVPMVNRYSKKTGQSFFGCVNFPNCKMIHK